MSSTPKVEWGHGENSDATADLQQTECVWTPDIYFIDRCARNLSGKRYVAPHACLLYAGNENSTRDRSLFSWGLRKL